MSASESEWSVASEVQTLSLLRVPGSTTIDQALTLLENHDQRALVATRDFDEWRLYRNNQLLQAWVQGILTCNDLPLEDGIPVAVLQVDPWQIRHNLSNLLQSRQVRVAHVFSGGMVKESRSAFVTLDKALVQEIYASQKKCICKLAHQNDSPPGQKGGNCATCANPLLRCS